MQKIKDIRPVQCGKDAKIPNGRLGPAPSSSSPTTPMATLADHVRGIAHEAASASGADRTLVMGIAREALNTLRQVGLSLFRATLGTVTIDEVRHRQRPEDVLQRPRT